ncbi:hypothetical protein Aduo_018721 [Ancylostoma duodenale]
MGGLAGPLRGLANPDVIVFFNKIPNELGFDYPEEQGEGMKTPEERTDIIAQGKAKNPLPNVNARSDVVIQCFGMTTMPFYTFLFGEFCAIDSLPQLQLFFLTSQTN